MCYEVITCPRCSSRNVVKNGRTRQRKQRYLCQDCRRQFIRDYTTLGCLPEIRDLRVVLTLNGCGVRDLARALRVSANPVLKPLRRAAAALPEPRPARRVCTRELDEFWSFVGRKRHPRWTGYAFDRPRRRVAAFVNGRRTDLSARALRRKLGRARVNSYRTDDWQSYRKCLPRSRRDVSKTGARPIERHNLNFRTRLKRLQRRTICYSRSEEMDDAVIKIFIHYSSPFVRMKLRF